MAHNAIDYMLALGQARCQAIIRERAPNRDTNDLGCWLWTRSLTSVGNSTGYAGLRRYTNGQLRQRQLTGQPLPRNSGQNFLLHRIAFVAHYGRNPTGQNVCSHLCANKNCFYWAHIVEESQAVNLSRDGCLGQLRCPSTQWLIKDFCSHVPACIIPPVTGVNCPCDSCRQAQESIPVSSDSSLVQGSQRDAVDVEEMDLSQSQGYAELVRARELGDHDLDIDVDEGSNSGDSSMLDTSSVSLPALVGGIPFIESEREIPDSVGDGSSLSPWQSDRRSYGNHNSSHSGKTSTAAGAPMQGGEQEDLPWERSPSPPGEPLAEASSPPSEQIPIRTGRRHPPVTRPASSSSDVRMTDLASEPDSIDDFVVPDGEEYIEFESQADDDSIL